MQIQDIADWLTRHDIQTELYKTHHPAHATEIVSQMPIDGPTILIAAGGDGTAAEVINGIMRHPLREHIQMGVLPLGTGNDFLKDFAVYTVEQALERILQKSLIHIDVGRVHILEPVPHDPFYFINMIGIGIIVEGARLRLERYLWAGKWGYHCAFFHLLTRFKSLPVSMSLNNDCRVQTRSPVLGICNSQYTGHGMRLSPASSPQDGRFELIYADELSVASLLSLFLNMSSGKHLHHPKVHVQPIRSLELQWQGLDRFMVDGEIREGSKIHVEIVPKALCMRL